VAPQIDAGTAQSATREATDPMQNVRFDGSCVPERTFCFRPIPDTVMTSGGAQLVFRFDLFGVLSSAAVVAL
jgi:hypothetical protein